jgi:hypothetical protein
MSGTALDGTATAVLATADDQSIVSTAEALTALTRVGGHALVVITCGDGVEERASWVGGLLDDLGGEDVRMAVAPGCETHGPLIYSGPAGRSRDLAPFGPALAELRGKTSDVRLVVHPGAGPALAAKSLDLDLFTRVTTPRLVLPVGNLTLFEAGSCSASLEGSIAQWDLVTTCPANDQDTAVKFWRQHAPPEASVRRRMPTAWTRAGLEPRPGRSRGWSRDGELRTLAATLHGIFGEATPPAAAMAVLDDARTVPDDRDGSR